MQSRQAEWSADFPGTRMNRERTAMLEDLMEQAVSPETGRRRAMRSNATEVQLAPAG